MSADMSLPPLIAAQVDHLLAHSPLAVKIDQIWSGCKDARYSDRFTLLVPFCLGYIKWYVLYNALHPMAAPDIAFSPDDEDFHPFPLAAEEAKSLSDWNSRDPTLLLSLVLEIRDLYMHYQTKRVAEVDDERLKFELGTVLSRKGIEVCMISALEKQEEVKFAVPLLDMNLNKLVPGCPWKHQQRIHLQVKFTVSKKFSSPPTPRLKLVSSSDLQTLFTIDDVKLPPWLDGMCMAEYLPTLESNLKSQVLEAVTSIGARRCFIESLDPVFGRPVEADPVFCRRAAVLSISGTFAFMVHFSLPTFFPKQQPILTMQSSQHFNSQGTPLMSPPIKDYPWSPRWDPSHMVDRIFDFLVVECLNFRKYCNDSISQQQ